MGSHPGSWQDALDRRFAEGVVWAEWVVSRWDGFPVEQRPDRSVLVGQRAFVERGFATAEAKMAYLNGQIESAIPVPDAVLRSLRQASNTVPARRPAPPPLLLQSVTKSETEFLTDRGLRRLAAWRLQAAGVLGANWVLDPDVDPPEWRPPEPPTTPRPALQSPLNDPGAYAEIIESAHAVAVVPAGQGIGPPGIRILPGHMHQITVRLTRPLGVRVFVDVHGHPGQVVSPRVPPGRSAEVDSESVRPWRRWV